MLELKTYATIIIVLLVLKFGFFLYEDYCEFSADNGYMTECIMHDPPTPVEYESRYLDGPNYIVTYEGRFRWNDEKCRERECVDATEYRRAKSIVGEQDGS